MKSFWYLFTVAVFVAFVLYAETSLVAQAAEDPPLAPVVAIATMPDDAGTPLPPPPKKTISDTMIEHFEQKLVDLKTSIAAPVYTNKDAEERARQISQARGYEIILRIIKDKEKVSVEEHSVALKTIDEALKAADKSADGDASKDDIPWLEQARSQLKSPELTLSPEAQKRKDIELRAGTLSYGPTLSLLRFRTSRAQDEPGRFRNYEPEFEFIPGEVGFQFVFRPAGRPWRQRTLDRKPFQLLSVGGVLLADVNGQRLNRGSLSLAATLSAFDDALGLGMGVDLYRGIPVRGADGVAGSETVYTGLLAWTAAREGELTSENFFFVVTLGLQPIVDRLTKEIQ